MKKTQFQVYLVTGVAGFIGSRTAKLLLNFGHFVVGIDSLNNYYNPEVKIHRLKILSLQSCFMFKKINIEIKKKLDNLFCEYVFVGIFHLAGRAGVRNSISNPKQYYRTNVEGSLNVLECMRYHNVYKLVLASTSSLYSGEKIPFSEKMSVNEPISPYSASKKASELISYTYYFLYKIHVSIVRYFTVYGPSGRPDMGIYRFIESINNNQVVKVLGDGSQTRDLTYVDDISRGNIFSMNSRGYQIFNLGGGQEPISINSIIGQIGVLTNKKVKINYLKKNKSDIYITSAIISKAKSIINWQPQMSFSDGLNLTIKWHLGLKVKTHH